MTIQVKTTARRPKTTTWQDHTQSNIKHTLYRRAIIEAFLKLDPRQQVRNPVMFVVTVGSVLTTVLFIRALLGGNDESSAITGLVTGWLWFTVLFSNFAEALAGGHIQIRAEALRRMHRQVMAKKLHRPEGKDDYEIVPAASLRRGDVVLVEAGETIPADGEVVEGCAPVDESALSGKSAPIAREAGGDHSAVTGGTCVLSDWLMVRISANPGEGLLDRLFNLVEDAERRKRPHKTLMAFLLAGSTTVFLLGLLAWLPYFRYGPGIASRGPSITVLIALLASLMPITTGGLSRIIDIAGLDRLIQRNVIALSDQALEAAGEVEVLLLDKCAAIVSDYRRAVAFIPLNETNFSEVVETARLAALANGTPESESIIALAEEQLGPGNGTEGAVLEVPVGAHVIPYTAETGLSGVELHEMSIRKGAPEAIITYLKTHGYPIPPDLNRVVERVAGQGGVSRVLVVNGQAVGVIHLRSLVNTALKKGLVRLRQMGLKTVLITGDTPFAAATIAAEAGMDDFLARATPATKLELIRRYQADGQRVAITGQGINDTSALIRAKVAVAMNAGAQLAREVANMVDLDSNPAKLIEIVEIGKQRLVTHRALTIFSLANDVAKYLALIPVMFALIFPAMDGLNFMHLATPTSTILAAVIFNALIMVALTPLALRGIPYRLVGTARLQRDILLLYGLSGLATLFIGIKVIDLILVGLGFV